jgi:hypothetical protein
MNHQQIFWRLIMMSLASHLAYSQEMEDAPNLISPLRSDQTLRNLLGTALTGAICSGSIGAVPWDVVRAETAEFGIDADTILATIKRNMTNNLD